MSASTPADEFSVFRLAFAGGGAVVFAAGAYFLEADPAGPIVLSAVGARPSA